MRYKLPIGQGDLEIAFRDPNEFRQTAYMAQVSLLLEELVRVELGRQSVFEKHAKKRTLAKDETSRVYNEGRARTAYVSNGDGTASKYTWPEKIVAGDRAIAAEEDFVYPAEYYATTMKKVADCDPIPLLAEWVNDLTEALAFQQDRFINDVMKQTGVTLENMHTIHLCSRAEVSLKLIESYGQGRMERGFFASRVLGGVVLL